MGGITARYKRATAALDERARARLWGRSGSESSASSSEADSAELADLVDSFYDAAAERGGSGDDEIIEPEWDSETNCGGRVGRDWTRALEAALGESEDDSVADRIRVEVERAIKLAGSSSDGFRRRVVTRLRNKGFNAGVCKSSWERSGSLPAGSHEYIDVITRGDGTARYIVEINIAAEFEIARPSTAYLKLLQTLPAVLVAKPEHLKEVVRVMCAAATESIKSAGMHVPPWRRKKYMLAKWFSSHTRATAGNTAEKDEEYSRGGRTAAQRPGVPSDWRFCRMDIGWGANLVVREKSAMTIYEKTDF
ncbi:uncharacterized protein LOC109711339 [Ananas comosus]|uniref:Uncharacterized protein LOC109711339 n=1 Tax=Ananas comosus TaxID=4615 RepID=A0A6P5F205_ANACO|nr:uncharacterized protein LOC109711339 [Ananas comosus]